MWRVRGGPEPPPKGSVGGWGFQVLTPGCIGTCNNHLHDGMGLRDSRPPSSPMIVWVSETLPHRFSSSRAAWPQTQENEEVRTHVWGLSHPSPSPSPLLLCGVPGPRTWVHKDPQTPTLGRGSGPPRTPHIYIWVYKRLGAWVFWCNHKKHKR